MKLPADHGRLRQIADDNHLAALDFNSRAHSAGVKRNAALIELHFVHCYRAEILAKLCGIPVRTVAGILAREANRRAGEQVHP